MNKKLLDRILHPGKEFSPCSAKEGDEIFQNGIFVYNVTETLNFIQNNPDRYPISYIATDEVNASSSSIDESHISKADTSVPILLIEIAPNSFNLMDGHHRLEKAKREEMEELPCYKISPPDHLQFLIEERAYQIYINYWNEKLGVSL